MPKGEKIKAKAIDGSATTWEILKIVELEFWFVQNTLIAKSSLLWGEFFIMGKGGVFESWLNFSWNDSPYVLTSVFDLEIGSWGWFTKTNQVVAKYDPYMPKWIKTILSVHLLWYCTCSSCFMLCWHKSPKRGRLKGKCALGPFLSILAIKCPTQVPKC